MRKCPEVFAQCLIQKTVLLRIPELGAGKDLEETLGVLVSGPRSDNHVEVYILGGLILNLVG